MDEIAERIYSDMGQIQDDTGMTVYAMCALFNDSSGSLYNISQLEVGCRAICERADQRKTLWQEYLPDLKLEVNRDGCFDQIQLIGDEDRRQNINTFVLDEKVRIPVIDGTVTFPANGAKYYDLPLVREVFGRHAKEKLARFVLEKPLKKPVQVELSVHYQYGDIDSYQLVAYSRELDQTIYSFWLDTEALVQILTVPKNSIVQQYKKLFELDNVELVFEEDALKAVAKKAQEQRTGARGLRGIMEGILTNLMFEIPSDPTIERVTITEKVVTEGSEPELLRNEDKAAVSINLKQDAKKRQKRSTAS